jgi:hypothetical protein
MPPSRVEPHSEPDRKLEDPPRPSETSPTINSHALSVFDYVLLIWGLTNALVLLLCSFSGRRRGRDPRSRDAHNPRCK